MNRVNQEYASQPKISEYKDSVHAEVLNDLQVGEFGYKYRMLNGIVMPPYITPTRYALSRRLKTRVGDICYTSYPKSGSTWLAYIILLTIRRGEPVTDETLRGCLHWVASSWTYPRSEAELETLPSPRIFKSHMPYDMALGGKPDENPGKYIYIARNPKDVVVSYYWFERKKSWSGYYSGSWDHWLEAFMKGRVQRGDWFDHTLSWWKYHDAGNILFLKYEDLKENLVSELDKIAKFLDYPLDQEIKEKIVQRASFNSMKKEPFSNMHEIEEFKGFFRSGRIGSWKDQFTASQSDRFDALYEERMAGSGLDFQFE